MNKKATTEIPTEFFFAKYFFVFVIFAALFLVTIGLIEFFCEYLEDNWEFLEKMERWLYFYLKGVLGGIVVWIYRGIARLIIDGILGGITFAYRSTREDGKIILNFIFLYLIVLGYPIFIMYGKRIIFDYERPDFETKHFLEGYCTVLFFVAIILKAIW